MFSKLDSILYVLGCSHETNHWVVTESMSVYVWECNNLILNFASISLGCQPDFVG